MSEQDKFNNEEEYHFVDDPELLSAEDGFHAEEEIVARPETTSTKKPSFEFSQLTKLDNILSFAKPGIELLQKSFILRMSVIGLAILFLILILYRCTAHHNSIAPQETHSVPQRPGAIQQMHIQRQPVQQINMDAAVASDAVFNKKLIDLESSQNNLQMQITELGTQLTGVNGNLNVVADSLKQLNDQVTQLALAVQDQAKVAAALTNQLKQQEKKKAASMAKLIPTGVPPVRYFLQAVIPGRAWLVNSNGDTFTVREGSKIANYGVVRYIDTKRGRVLTSSGKIIKFSQDDN